MIYVLHPAPPTIPDEIAEELERMSPRVFLRWNREYAKSEKVLPDGRHPWEGRWEIWCELEWSRHPDAQNEIAEGDLWNTEAQCWMRRLQTYQTADGKFAPADQRLIWGLQLADAWADEHFYETNVDNPHLEREAESKRIINEAASGAANYYRKLENPIVGPHGSGGDWRWRIR